MFTASGTWGCYRFDGGPSLRLPFSSALMKPPSCYRFDGGPSLRLEEGGLASESTALLPFRRWPFIEAEPANGPRADRRRLLPFRRWPFIEAGVAEVREDVAFVATVSTVALH